MTLDAWSMKALVYGGYVFGLCVAVRALLNKKRNPSGALVWVVTCVALPYLGGILYLMVGDDHVTRRRRRRIRAAHHRYYADVRRRRRETDGGRIEEQLTCPVPSLQRLADAEVRAGNSGDVLVGGAEAYDRMIEAISGASKSIYLQTYIFDADATGRRFVDALAERARSGVKVRLLYDAVGTSNAGARLVASLVDAGARTASFLPFHPLKRRFQVNLRNHRKILVVDDVRAFTGSMNISARHMVEGREGSRDLVVEFRGPVVGDFADVFASDWEFAADERLRSGDDPPSAVAGDETLQLVESGPDRVDHGVKNVILSAIYAARRDVLLLTPYFVPPVELLTALQTCAARGVRVRLVIPGRSGQWLIHLATRASLAPLLKEHAEISERPGTLLHMKLMIVDDDVAVVGSSNLDHRSFFLNFEADVVVYGGTLLRKLRDVAEVEWRASVPMPEEKFERLPLFERVGIRVAALFAPVL